MSKNLIPKICKLLGVELGEEFKVRSKGITLFKFCSLGLEKKAKNGDWYADTAETFSKLCQGTEIITKLPWKPKFGDRYFGFFEFNGKLMITRYDIWRGTIEEEAQYKCGWVFRTREEVEAALPDVAKELGVEYEL